MLLNARTAAARSASFFHHLQASRVRPSKGFCWQGHRGRIDSRCVGQHNGSVALPEGQMEAQSVSKALSQVELLMQQGSRMTAVAQSVWAAFVQQGDMVVDATCGNGHDTKWLAEAVGPRGTVYAFDIQEDAIRSTKAVLEDEIDPAKLPKLELITGCHSCMKEHVKSSVRLVCFNLGYLPGGEKEVTTRPSTTIAAVEAALHLLQPSGLLSALCYIGHSGGQEEYEAVRHLGSQQHPDNFTVFENRILNRPNAPILLLFWRRPVQA